MPGFGMKAELAWLALADFSDTWTGPRKSLKAGGVGLWAIFLVKVALAPH